MADVYAEKRYIVTETKPWNRSYLTSRSIEPEFRSPAGATLQRLLEERLALGAKASSRAASTLATPKFVAAIYATFLAKQTYVLFLLRFYSVFLVPGHMYANWTVRLQSADDNSLHRNGTELARVDRQPMNDTRSRDRDEQNERKDAPSRIERIRGEKQREKEEPSGAKQAKPSEKLSSGSRSSFPPARRYETEEPDSLSLCPGERRRITWERVPSSLPLWRRTERERQGGSRERRRRKRWRRHSSAVATPQKAEECGTPLLLNACNLCGGRCTVHLNTCHVAAGLLQNDVRDRRGSREFAREHASISVLENA